MRCFTITSALFICPFVWLSCCPIIPLSLFWLSCCLVVPLFCCPFVLLSCYPFVWLTFCLVVILSLCLDVLSATLENLKNPDPSCVIGLHQLCQ